MRLVFDFECTGAQRDKAHPFNLDNKACNLGFRNIDTGEIYVFKLEYDSEPFGEQLRQIQGLLDQATLLVGFNAKFDCHWLRRYRLSLGKSCRVWDCQLAFFILTAQQHRFPSLDQVAEFCGVEKKLDIVKTEYWDKGLDTDQVPYSILEEYLRQDLLVTQQVFLSLISMIRNQSLELQKLVSVSMQDLLVLEDIEWNGLLVDVEKSIRKGDELQTEIDQLATQFRALVGEDWVNLNSGDHLSWCLYGGTLMVDGFETYEFTYKDGRTITKERKTKVPRVRKGIFVPLEGTELSKPGFYSTDEATLKNLSERARGVQEEVIQILLKQSKLEKQRSTYFHGIPKRIEKSNWKDNVVHSSFNQTVAISGRLSSDKPNVQNLEKKIKEVFVSRFPIRR
jgi:DNA polymerase I-like protein with 3'-5' exonuclease and polymerase domains